MQRETKKFLRLALLWYLFFCSGLKPNLQYLWGVPVLGFIFALLPCFLCVCVFFVALSLLIAFFCIELISSHLKVKVKLLSHVRLFATQWTVAYQAPPSMGFSRQECWSGLPFPSPGDLPTPGIKPGFPSLQADALPSELPGKPISSSILISWIFFCTIYFLSNFLTACSWVYCIHCSLSESASDLY